MHGYIKICRETEVEGNNKNVKILRNISRDRYRELREKIERFRDTMENVETRGYNGRRRDTDIMEYLEMQRSSERSRYRCRYVERKAIDIHV